MAMHFPEGVAQMQSAPSGTYPRVSVFENSGVLYVRMGSAATTYLEYQIDQNSARAVKVTNGSSQIKTLTTFD